MKKHAGDSLGRMASAALNLSLVQPSEGVFYCAGAAWRFPWAVRTPATLGVQLGVSRTEIKRSMKQNGEALGSMCHGGGSSSCSSGLLKTHLRDTREQQTQHTQSLHSLCHRGGQHRSSPDMEWSWVRIYVCLGKPQVSRRRCIADHESKGCTLQLRESQL